MHLTCPECNAAGVNQFHPDPDTDTVIFTCQCGYWTALRRRTVDRWLAAAA